MHDDISSIPNGGCNVLTGSSSLSNYNNNIRKDFIFSGSKWYLYRTQTANYGSYDISPYNCIDVTTLNSNAVFEPFIYGLGFCLFLVAVLLFFKTIKGFLHVI